MGRTSHAPPAARWSVLRRSRWDSFSQVESLALLHRARNCFRCAALMELSVSALYLTFDCPCMGAIKLHARASINVRARESKRRSNAIKEILNYLYGPDPELKLFEKRIRHEGQQCEVALQSRAE